jgi:type IV pilus assembly protein PilO
MKLSPRYTLILTAVGILVFVVILAVVLVVPQFGKLAEIESMIGDADDQAAQAESLLTARQEAKEQAAFTDAALLELATAVPENPDLPSVIIELQDLAYDCNVQLRVIAPTDLVQSTGYVTMPFEVEVWGSWADAVDFVQRVEQLERQVRIVESTTQVLDEGDLLEAVDDLDDYSVTTTLLLESYVIPASPDQTGTVPPAPAAAPGAPAPAPAAQ